MVDVAEVHEVVVVVVIITVVVVGHWYVFAIGIIIFSKGIISQVNVINGRNGLFGYNLQDDHFLLMNWNK